MSVSFRFARPSAVYSLARALQLGMKGGIAAPVVLLYKIEREA